MMIALLDPAQIERIRGLVGRQQPEAIDIEGPAAGKVADAELDMARAHDVERRIEDGRPYGHWLLCFFHSPADASRACPTCASIVAKPGQARVSWRGGSAACEANADGVGGLILLPVCGSPPTPNPSPPLAPLAGGGEQQVTPPAPWPSSSRGHCCCECGIRGRFPEPRPKGRAGSWRRRFPGAWRRRRIPSRQSSGGSPADVRSRPGS